MVNRGGSAAAADGVLLRFKLGPLLTLGALVVLPMSVMAQEQLADGRSSSSCQPDSPPRECSFRWITEAGFTFRLSDDTVLYPSFELGSLWNVGSTVGFGIAGYVGFNDGFLWGPKPRVRVWTGAATAVDVAAGVLCCDNRHDDSKVRSGHVGLVFGDHAAVLQVERRQRYRVDRGLFYDNETFLGGKVGSTAGIVTGVATAAVGAGILIWLISELGGS